MRLLLLSNSTQHGRAMLDHAEVAVRDHLEGLSRVLFVPFALKDHAAYTAMVAERLNAQGMTVTGQGPAEFSAFMKKEVERWSKIVKENRISAGT